jgi:hypothetical protein
VSRVGNPLYDGYVDFHGGGFL